MKILNFDSQVFLAPMAGITDRPMRSLVSSFGGGIIYSEMAAINAMERKNPKSLRIVDVKDEPYKVVVQLVGNNPNLFAEAAKIAEEYGASSLDINMGCPVKKIVNNNSGSALMRDYNLASSIIKSVVGATKLPVSVKFRKSWDLTNINAVDFARLCEDSGASYVSVHGRTRSQFYSGEADWDIIAQVKSAIKIPVVGNGDVTDIYEAKRMLDYTNVDGVMVGRATLGAPWLIADVDNYLKNGIIANKKSSIEIKDIMLKHIDSLRSYYGDATALPLSRKYACWYSKGLRDAKKFREIYTRLTDFKEAIKAIEEYFDSSLDFEEDIK